MPKTTNMNPTDGTKVRFRTHSDKNMLHGTYSDEKGFEACSGFICYTVAEVYYWQYDEEGVDTIPFVDAAAAMDVTVDELQRQLDIK